MKKIEKLLILSDFSELSLPLLKYGLALGEHLQAKVWIQYVYQITANISGDLYISPNVLESFEREVYDKYEKLKSDIPALQNENVMFEVNSGDLMVEANELIDKEEIDLLIIGNRSEGFLTNILGSTANKMIQHAHCPVLSIPEKGEFTPFKRLAIAIDLQQSAPEIISFLADFTNAFKSRVDIIHVSQAPVPVDASQLVNKLDHHFENVQHQFFHIHATEVEEAIERHVERNSIDLLVLMPREHPFFDRLFQKSISRQAAYQKKIPLLTVKQ